MSANVAHLKIMAVIKTERGKLIVVDESLSVQSNILLEQTKRIY